ncbi:MAG: TonB-dependent receptor [Bryobacterales bacterium]|nr:TonB-dependent receptor [Bryobacterales bacterium]
MRFVQATLGLSAAVLLLCAPLRSQFGTSTISGAVTDATGAVIPGVTVTVVNTRTNFTFSAETNAGGLYRVASLQPGVYRITFEVAGFKRTVREGVDVRTGETLPVNATLEVGAVAESIEITGRPQLLETETSATGSVVGGDLIYDLPIYQRWVASTFQLVPGISQGGYAWGGSLGGFHVAGQRASAIGYFEDGVVAQDQGGGTDNINPVLNAVEEIKVLTTALPAEYGHSAGGVISTVKKTGTNTFHGLASIFGRSRNMTHRRFFDKCRTSQSDQGCIAQGSFFFQPDFNLNGPVYIPKVYDGRNKTFWLIAYQKLIEKKTNQWPGTVPTTEMFNGDFTFGGKGNPLYDPLSTRQLPDGTWARDPIPNRLIPRSRIDPVAQKVLSINPWKPANNPVSYTSTGPVDNLIYDELSRTFFNDWSMRGDHQFSPYLKIFGSYTRNWRSGYGRPTNIRIADFDANNGNLTPSIFHNWALGKTWVISPTMVNDIRAGYYRYRRDRTVPSFGEGWPSQLGIPNVDGALLPSFGSGNQFSPESIYGLTVSGPSVRIGETLSFRDDFSIVKGTHAFKMGYELLRFRLNYSQTNHPSGDFRFDRMTAGLQPNGQPLPNTGNTFAGFLLGSVRSVEFDSELASWLPRSSVHSFYFQDDWKLTPTLTLNLGLRYSTESPFDTKYGLHTNFDPTVIDDASGLIGAYVHPGSGLNKRDNNNIQPRFGVAWHPVDKWVFRGGFAVNTVDVRFPAERGQFEEYFALANLSQKEGDPRPLFQISNGPPPFSFDLRPDGTARFVGANPSSRSAQWWDPVLRNPYVLNWNLSIQYELTPSLLLETSYQGSSGVGLVERWEYNTFPIDFGANDPALRAAAFAKPQNYRPHTNFGSVQFRSNMGHSTYHGGTVKLEQRYSRGLTFMTFYTFQKAINSQDNDNSGSGVAPIQSRALEKARAGYDRNHRWNGTITYELPFGEGRRWMNRRGVLDYIFGGWQIAWVQTVESGNPLNFSFDNNPYNYFPTWVGARRPDIVGTPQLRDNWGDFGGDRFNRNNINPVIDMSAFASPGGAACNTLTPTAEQKAACSFLIGNAGRNVVTGMRLLWSTVSAQKNIRLYERLTFQVRWDMNNPFKTFNFDTPSTTVDLKNPQTFAKVSGDPRTASWGGQPLMNLTLALMW